MTDLIGNAFWRDAVEAGIVAALAGFLAIDAARTAVEVEADGIVGRLVPA